MGKEAIIERIQSDARAEAEEIVSRARLEAEKLEAEACARAEEESAQAREEISLREKAILEGRAAAGRLDAKKIVLAEKRKVIEEIYSRALDALLSLGEHESLVLVEKLLTLYAEEGDEVIFARNFAYAEEAARIKIVGERALSVSRERADIDGGFLLLSEKCDKDVSFRTLLEADREAHESELSEALFGETIQG